MLKDCPFCGAGIDETDSDCCHPNGTAWLFEREEGFRRYVRASGEVPREQWCWEINCVKHYGGCGANISGDTREEAISNWNRRV